MFSRVFFRDDRQVLASIGQRVAIVKLSMSAEFSVVIVGPADEAELLGVRNILENSGLTKVKIYLIRSATSFNFNTGVSGHVTVVVPLSKSLFNSGYFSS